MPKISRPRKGSLQYYPRKRARKILPSVNWKTLSKTQNESVLGFIAYKVGMATAIVQDSTPHSMTAKKQIAVPATILEVPNMKLFAVRFYKDGTPIKDIIVSKENIMKKKVKIPKALKDFEKEIPKEYDDIRLIAHSIPKQTSIKKKPDISEIAISSADKLTFAKQFIQREITLEDFIKENIELLDIRGITTGKGTQGPVKRFGIKLKSHKSEKGRRTPGSIAPWHPARITFRAPMAGQLGTFTRTHLNHKIILSGKISEKDINPKSGFKNFGKIKSSYIILKGSIQGPSKRQLILTQSFRPTKKQSKAKYEFIKLLTK